MPEINVLHVWEWRGEPLVGGTSPVSYSVEKPSGYLVWTTDENFGLDQLVELSVEHGITRWAENTPDNGLGLDPAVVLVGWGEAPISRDDVQLSYHQGHREERPPMVNIKVHNTDLPGGDEFASLVGEFDLDDRLAALAPAELRTLVVQCIEKHADSVWQWACTQRFDDAAEEAKSRLFADYNVKVFSEGRQGGWLVVHGLPPVESWGPDLLTAWHEFEQLCAELVADVPRTMAWDVLANYQDELAGRVMRVQLTFVLADADLDGAGNDPTEWAWSEMLDLDEDTTLTVTPLP